MTCDNASWKEAANDYDADMQALRVACEEREAAKADLTAAQAAVVTAQEALAAAEAKEQMARDKASVSQLRMVTESEALGVQCACPGEIEPEPEPTGSNLGG